MLFLSLSLPVCPRQSGTIISHPLPPSSRERKKRPAEKKGASPFFESLGRAAPRRSRNPNDEKNSVLESRILGGWKKRAATAVGRSVGRWFGRQRMIQNHGLRQSMELLLQVFLSAEGQEKKTMPSL